LNLNIYIQDIHFSDEEEPLSPLMRKILESSDESDYEAQEETGNDETDVTSSTKNPFYKPRDRQDSTESVETATESIATASIASTVMEEWGEDDGSELTSLSVRERQRRPRIRAQHKIFKKNEREETDAQHRHQLHLDDIIAGLVALPEEEVQEAVEKLIVIEKRHLAKRMLGIDVGESLENQAERLSKFPLHIRQDCNPKLSLKPNPNPKPK